jgi:phage portal protein BeeE
MVFDFLRKAEPVAVGTERKASAVGRVVAWGSGGRVAWSPRDTVSLARSGYQGNPIGFRAIRLIAEAAAALPLVCQDVERRYETHPLLDLIKRPNAAQGRAEFLEAVYSYLLLAGNAYVEAVPGAGALPGELHVLRSDRISLVPGSDGWPVAYDYTVSGRTHRYQVAGPARPICHLRSFHPQDDHYGFSPLQAAATAVDVHTRLFLIQAVTERDGQGRYLTCFAREEVPK